MTITLKLDPAPTFKATVNIPVAGSKEGADIVCEFVHMTKDAYAAWAAREESMTDAERGLEILKSWQGPDQPFSAESLGKLFQNYPGSAYAITFKFATELNKNRSGN